MSWDRVEDWVFELSCIDPDELHLGVGGREIWRRTLDALHPDALLAASVAEGTPYETAAFVAARTVTTAPIEWCALLLGHGTKVVLKHPKGEPGAAPALAQAAQRVGLPLTATDDRAVIDDVELVIAMGSDETMEALKGLLPDSTDSVLFGHRFSAAWIDEDRITAYTDVAAAVWPHDSRGCMSPQVVFTTAPLNNAVSGLAKAMERAQQEIPRGWIGAAEGAAIRARGALARVTGVERHGNGWAVHGLPARHWFPEALPRCVAVIQVRDRAEARAIIAPWSRWLSTVGDDGDAPWFDARVCPVHAMQDPPVDRLHDGVHTLTAVLRQT